MKLIIAGAGRIGGALAEALSAEKHDIAVIDRDTETLSHVSDDLDVICLEGSATNPDVLREAGAAEADLLIAATEQDEINLVCGLASSKLGTKHVIARVRDPEYLGKTEFLRETFGISMLFNPEYECAKDISRTLRFPGASRVDSFTRGSAEIVEYHVPRGSRLAGVSLRELQGRFRAHILVSLAERDGKVEIPKGDFCIQENDSLSITGSPKEIRRFFVAAGAYVKPVRRVMITGGDRCAVYLARLLMESGIEVAIIENDRARCERLCELVPDARIICGNAARSDVLAEEGIHETDGFVALMEDDGDNIVTAIYAKRCHVGKVIARVNHAHFAEILDNRDLDSVVIPKTIVVQLISRYVRAMSNSAGSSMETLYRLADGKAEALEFRVSKDARCAGIPLSELNLKPNVLIAGVIRGNKTLVPDGSTVIQPGDHAVIVTDAGWLQDIDSILK